MDGKSKKNLSEFNNTIKKEFLVRESYPPGRNVD
jgi:hypothetical protein